MKTAFDLLTKESQKEFWAALALRHCKNMTPRLMRSLLVYHGSAYAAFCSASQEKILAPSVPKKLLPQTVLASLRQEKWRIEALHEWHLSKNFQGEIILWTDYRYPLGLKQIIDAPAFFYACGDTSLLASPSVAIVGSRKYHSLTLEKTYNIAHDLSSCGICVISGMAKGIDFAAHTGALKAIGKTIAILGCGADVIYPPEHFRLYSEIKENGLIISEFPPQTKPLPQNFPIRNRLISGLSEAVLVAEAAPKSGSLITARLALEQNRNVYVLHPVDENHSLGCHALIQDGAIQVEDALSIIMDIAPHLQESITKEERQKESKTKEDITAEDITASIPTNIITKEKEHKNNSKSYLAEQIRKRPQLNNNLSILDINFATMANELMGTAHSYKASDILSQYPKNKRKHILSRTILSKTMSKNAFVQSSEISFQNNMGKKTSKKASKKQVQNIQSEHKENTQVPISKERKNLDELEKQILDILDNKIELVPDEILVRLPPHLQNISTLSMSLLMLEVEEYIIRLSGNRYRNL